MKYGLYAASLLLLLLLCPTAFHAQEKTPGAEQSVERLRSQLSDIETKQAALEARIRQLDEEMRPENIERSTRLMGSTRPEELREQRRRQLEKERASVQSQLDQLATSRTRLQSALTTAEAAAYQQSAGVSNITATAAAGAPVQTRGGGSNEAQRAARPAQTDSKRRRARRNRAGRRTP